MAMRDSVLTLQIGNCGNKLGETFWSVLRAEHGIDSGDDTSIVDRRDVFFRETTQGHWSPRAMLVDTKSARMNALSRDIFEGAPRVQPKDGSGAGNRWTQGRIIGEELRSSFDEALNTLAEQADSVRGVQVIHSLGGGTGSGVGSWALQHLRDTNPKWTLWTHSVFPQREVSEAVIQPYNVVPSIADLAQHSDMTVCYDNDSLGRMAALLRYGDDRLVVGGGRQSFLGHNMVAARVMADITASLRFPQPQALGSFSQITSAVVPDPTMNFVVPASTQADVTPTDQPTLTQELRRITAQDVLRRLLRPRARLVAFNRSEHTMISGLALLRGSTTLASVSSGLEQVRSELSSPLALRAVLVPSSPNSTRVSGTLLSVSTGVADLFQDTLRDLERLRRRGAFAVAFGQDLDMQQSDFNESLNRAVAGVQDVVRRYSAARTG